MKRSAFVLFASFVILLSGCSLFSSDEPQNPPSEPAIQDEDPPDPGDEDGGETTDEGTSQRSEVATIDLDAIPQTHEVAGFTEIALSSLPNKTNEISAKSPISITFAGEMDTKSVEEAIIIEPKVAGTYTWEENTVTFTPQEEYSAGTKYTLTLTKEAFDKAGNNLPEEFSKNFEVTDELKILAVVPADGLEVSTDTDVSIIFNQPIFELGAIDELEKHDFGLKVEPAFPFRYRLASTNTLQIHGQMPADGFVDGITLTEGEKVEHRLPRSTSFSITVPKEFPSLSGGTLTEDKTFTFTTPRIRLETTYIGEIHPFRPLTLSFNQPVDLESLQGKLTLLDENQAPVEYSLQYYSFKDGGEDASEVEVIPLTKFWEYSSAYSILVESGVSGTEGNLTTEEVLSTTFSTRAFVVIESPSDPMKSGPEEEYTLFFDQPPVSLQDISDNFSIPEAAGGSIRYKKMCTDPAQRGTTWEETCEKINDPRRIIVSFKDPLENEKNYGFVFSAGLPVTITADESRPEIVLSNEWLGKGWTLPEDVYVPFTIVPKPEVIGTYSEEGSYKELCIFTNNPFNDESVLKNLHFDPAPPADFTISITPVWNDYQTEGPYWNCQVPKYTGKNAIQITMKLDFEEDYRVWLDTKVEDVFGQKLSNEYTFEHSTGPLLDEDIMLNAVSPYSTIVPYDGNPVVVFHSVNIPDSVTLDICKADITAILEKEDALYNSYHDTPWIPDSGSCEYFTTVEKQIPDSPWEDIYLEADLKEILGDKYVKGAYIVSAHHPRVTDTIYESGYFGGQNEKKVTRYSPVVVQVTDLALVSKDDNEHLFAWVSRISNGDPVSADISSLTYDWTFSQRKLIERALGTTDETGVIESAGNTGFSYLLARSKDGDSIALSSDWYAGDYRYPGGYIEGRGYIFTDRPIYRPGDAVEGKAILVTDKDLTYSFISNAMVKMTVRDSQWNTILEGEKYTTNKMGALHFSFPLPKDVGLGYVSIELCTEGWFNSYCFSSSVSVEEYKKPEFEVTAESSKPDYLQGEEVSLAMSADYYFGAPVAGGEMNYSLKRSTYRFDRYDDEDGFVFEEGGGLWIPYWYGDYDYGYGSRYSYSSSYYPYDDAEYLGNEIFTLDENGKYTKSVPIALPLSGADAQMNPPTPDKRITFDPVRVSKTYTVEVTAEDSNKNPVYSSASFTAHGAKKLVGLKPEKWSGKAGEEMTIHTVIVDTDGNPLSGEKAHLTVILEEQVEDEKKEEDTSRYSYKTYHLEEAIIAESDVTSAELGKGSYSFTPPEDKPGTYKVVAEMTDDLGQKQRASFSLYIYSKDYVDVTQLEEKRIDIIPDKSEYAVGDKAILTVKSPLSAGSTNYLLTKERGFLYDSSLMTLTGDPVIEVEVTEEMVPNMHVTLLGQQYGAEPALAYGEFEITTSTKAKELGVAITTDKEEYLPGEEVTLTVSVDQGNAPAEIAVIVVDKANLALVASSRQKILDFFYSKRSISVRTLATLLHLNTEIDLSNVTSVPLTGGGGMDYAEGAMNIALPSAAPMDMMAEEADFSAQKSVSREMADDEMKGGDGLASKKRTDFKDTALFEAIQEIGEDGKTEVVFTLPDNLTTWEVIVIGLNENFQAGEGEKEIRTKKPLLLRPQTPRFIRFGDSIELRANIHNETDSALSVITILTAENLSIEDTTEETTIPAHDSADVVFRTSASKSVVGEKAVVTFKAEGGGYVDEVEMSFPVLHYSTPEVVASSGVTTTLSYIEKVRLPDYVVKSLGYLTITTSATLANFLDSGLNYLVQYPYGCNEQIASALLGLVLYNEATNLPNFEGHLIMPSLYDEYGNLTTYENAVSEAVDTLTKNQRYDGGWGYWVGSVEPSAELTAHILYVFSILQENNVQYSSNIVPNASNFLLNYYETKRDLDPTELEMKYSYQADARAFMLFALSTNNPEEARLKGLTDFSLEKQDLLTNYGQVYLLLHLQNMGIEEKIREKLHESLQSKLEIDPRGMFLNPGDDGWYYTLHNSGHKLTALYLKALVRDEEGKLQENPFIPRMIRWLTGSRHDGQWHDTQATVAVLDAFVDYLDKSKENLADYDATIVADQREVEKYHVDGDTLFDTHEIRISAEDIVDRGDKGLIVQFLKEGSEEGALYYDLVLKYYLPIDKIEAREEGMTILREYYSSDDTALDNPVSGGSIGDVIKGRITVVVPDERHFVAVENPIPSGTELINFNLATSDKSILNQPFEEPTPTPYFEDYYDGGYAPRSYKISSWWWWNPWTHTEMRDDRLLLFADYLSPGVYTYDFYLRVTHSGEFVNPPARAEEMYFPEIWGRTGGSVFTVKQ